MRSVSLLSLLFAAATSAVASVPTTSITFQIAIPEHLQQQQQGGQNLDTASIQQQFLAKVPAWTRATLESGDATSGRHTYTSAPITASGKLVFSNVTAGSYLGEVHCATHVFVPLRVDIDGIVGETEGAGQVLTARVTETYRGNDWANQGEALRKVAVDGTARSGPTFIVAPLTLATKSYYTARSTFDVLSLLKNPMILMALFAMVMMFGMPYLMDSSTYSFCTIKTLDSTCLILTTSSGPRDEGRVRGAAEAEPDGQPAQWWCRRPWWRCAGCRLRHGCVSCR